jgi:pimeloyl-ACP methyl ester carboxylesterase
MLRGLWTEMRGNAEFSTMTGRAVDLTAKKLIALRDALLDDNRTLEVHIVGHSAGAILLGWLLDRLAREDLLPRQLVIKSSTLYAPACSVQFALGTYAKVAATPLFKLNDLWIHYLSAQNEKADGLPDAQLRLYGKSLLYLVSRALDDSRKMPLLGLQNAITPTLFDAKQWADEELASIAAWQQVWVPGAAGATQRGFAVTTRDVRVTKTGATVQATHGCFDNDIDVIAQTLTRIKGGALVSPIEWLDF